jgi:amidase
MNRREFVEGMGVLTAMASGSAAAGGGPAATEFDVREKSIAQLSRAQADGQASAESLTRSYLARIERFDRSGPQLRAVLALNPRALDAARTLDAARRAGKLAGPLHGIPILLKDNIETLDPLPTTGGSLALAEARHSADAPVAARLRAAGAVVIGKANLSEWANFRSSRSVSGWSGVGGQTRCPYDPTRNPSGSSAGPGSGTAANLCAASVGSETDGSILAPASINGLVGHKPTLGLVSGAGVVPISTRQDTTGPMTRTVADAALMLSVMAEPSAKWDAAAVAGTALEDTPRGLKLGVLPPPSSTHPLVLKQWPEWLELLKKAGCTLIDVRQPAGWDTLMEQEFEALLFDFKEDINAYLARFNGRLAVRTLADLIEFNDRNAEREMPFFGQELFIQSQAKGPRSSAQYQKVRGRINDLSDAHGLGGIFETHRVDALVASGNGPAELIDHVWGDHYENSGGWPPMCSAAAIVGYPSLTVPAGFVFGLPVGIHFVAPRWHDGRLLQIGRCFERARNARQPPRLASDP